MYFLPAINATIGKTRETIEIIAPILNDSDEYSNLTMWFPFGIETALKV